MSLLDLKSRDGEFKNHVAQIITFLLYKRDYGLDGRVREIGYLHWLAKTVYLFVDPINYPINQILVWEKEKKRERGITKEIN